jgi:uncharacterized protein
MLLNHLHSHKFEIEAAAKAFGARRIRVFGSVAREEDGEASDIDFLVDFPKGYDMFSQRLALIERLSELTGRQVEVIPEHELNQYIRDQILSEAREL